MKLNDVMIIPLWYNRGGVGKTQLPQVSINISYDNTDLSGQMYCENELKLPQYVILTENDWPSKNCIKLTIS